MVMKGIQMGSSTRTPRLLSSVTLSRPSKLLNQARISDCKIFAKKNEFFYKVSEDLHGNITVFKQAPQKRGMN